MKMLNAWTMELGSAEIAVAEILEMLDLESNLLSHSAGFITCSCDFIETGMVRAICEALPFEVVGCTTLTNSNNEEGGAMLLALSVLTADDCVFSAVSSASLSGGLGPVGEAYSQAAKKLGEEPKLALAFMPMMSDIGGELILDELDRAAGGVPIFGTIACDFDTANYTNTHTLCCGEGSRDAMALLLIGGNVNPRFVVTATSEQNLQKQQAIVTASEGSLMKSVNGMSARDYFTSLGLLRGSGADGLSSVPFVVDYGDGTQPVARAIYSIREDGSAVCGGVMPEGGQLFIGRMDVEDILLTAEQSIKKLLSDGPPAGIIFFPCLGRNMVLGMEPMLEIDKVREHVPESVPWHLAYSGGEICPVYNESGQTANRFHNFTFIACAL